MSDKSKCKRCRYWRSFWGGSEAVCHHLLDTDKRRVEVNGVCKSFKARGEKDSNA